MSCTNGVCKMHSLSSLCRSCADALLRRCCRDSPGPNGSAAVGSIGRQPLSGRSSNPAWSMGSGLRSGDRAARRAGDLPGAGGTWRSCRASLTPDSRCSSLLTGTLLPSSTPFVGQHRRCCTPGSACRSVQAPGRHRQPGPVPETVSVCRQVWEFDARRRRQGVHQRGTREGFRRQFLARAVHSRSGARSPVRWV